MATRLIKAGDRVEFVGSKYHGEQGRCLAVIADPGGLNDWAKIRCDDGAVINCYVDSKEIRPIEAEAKEG